MWYIARIPSSENPANPGFHEVIGVDRNTGAFVWTPLLSQAMTFSSKDAAGIRLALLPQRDQDGAAPKYFRFSGR